MIIRFPAPLFLATLLVSGSAFAAGGSVTILSPANGATLNANEDLTLSYEAIPGPGGDHLHVYLDWQFVNLARSMKGEVRVGALSPGKHHLCVTVASAGHMPTGKESCVDVIAQ